MNNIQLITKYSTKAWDKVYKAESRAAILDGQDGVNIQWTGAKTVKIAKFQAGGLKNYYRNNNGDARVKAADPANNKPFGYQQSSVGLTWQERTVRMDRAAYYPIELFDNEETDGLTLGAATTEVSRTIIIPEVDAYCFSEIAAACSSDLGNLVDNVAVSKANAVEELNKGLLYFDNNEVPAEDQVIFVSPRYLNYLRNDNTELNRFLMQADFKKDISYTVTSYEGRQLVVVPPQRFRTAFTTDTQSGEGYGFGYYDETAEAVVASKDINFIICAKSAVIHVVKYNKVKILSGDVVLAMGFDGYALFARVYHDLFVLDNKKYAIYTSLQKTGEDQLTIATVSSSTAAKEVKTGVNSKLPQD
ncbi:MAG: hypothetical protein IKF82_01350 [Bacilli bacterium]|nr:hypothetical protein [Bacilli bacterium]